MTWYLPHLRWIDQLGHHHPYRHPYLDTVGRFLTRAMSAFLHPRYPCVDPRHHSCTATTQTPLRPPKIDRPMCFQPFIRTLLTQFRSSHRPVVPFVPSFCWRVAFAQTLASLSINLYSIYHTVLSYTCAHLAFLWFPPAYVSHCRSFHMYRSRFRVFITITKDMSVAVSLTSQYQMQHMFGRRTRNQFCGSYKDIYKDIKGSFWQTW